MFGHTRRALGALAGATAVTLAVGVGATTAVVPKLASGTDGAGSAAVVLAGVAGMVAGVLPARRASRRPVLDAVAAA